MQLEIKALDEKKAAIFVDEELWKTLDKKLLLKELSKLKNCESLAQLEEQFQLIEEKAAKKLAIHMLAKRAYLSSELEKKLKDRLLSESSIQKAIAYSKQLGALRDDKVIEYLLEKRIQKGYSLFLAKKLLYAKMKGVEIAPSSHLLNLEKSSAKKLMEKKFGRLSKSDPKNLQKIYQFFSKRGFSRDFIYALLQA